jgi:hypothetical protein
MISEADRCITARGFPLYSRDTFGRHCTVLLYACTFSLDRGAWKKNPALYPFNEEGDGCFRTKNDRLIFSRFTSFSHSFTLSCKLQKVNIDVRASIPGNVRNDIRRR